MKRINPGREIETAIDWLSTQFSPVFDGISTAVDTIVTAFQSILLLPHPSVIVIVTSALMYYLNVQGTKLLSAAGWKKGGGITVFTVLGLTLLYFMGLWTETMETCALVISSTFLALLFGIPLGILSARNDRIEQIVRPVLDFMQTMPPFVYLIPAILFFGVGNVPGVVATVVFALPPAVRLTSLGIRNVSKEVVEASISFGTTKRQLLLKVQIPLAKSTILAGINQVIMLALSMVVIASMVGASGLGQEVYKGILKADLALGFNAGLGIVIVAIILDRMTQTLGNLGKKQKRE